MNFTLVFDKVQYSSIGIDSCFVDFSQSLHNTENIYCIVAGKQCSTFVVYSSVYHKGWMFWWLFCNAGKYIAHYKILMIKSDLLSSLGKALQVWGYVLVMYKIITLLEVGLANIFLLVHISCCFSPSGHKTMF